MTLLLETERLGKRFGGVVAVNDVSFAIKEGELRCLIGPNGAGKSTFFKMLTGQLVPTSGSITFRGRQIAGATSHAIARLGIGIKTQVPSVFDGLAVEENIFLAARRSNTAHLTNRIVQEVLERIRLTAKSRALVGQLSHGERQWVEIGMVLAVGPQLILLDEPAAGMTREEVSRTAEIIRELNSTQAIVIVEHDMEFVRMIAKTVTVFHQGQILIEDDVDAVMRNERVRDIYLGKKAAA
jgi:branched-chain amino acid transport system ATP-binding protein/urea transport system ATP-binding protein